MKNLRTKILPSILAMSALALVAGCDSASESSSPWVKSDSPWGKRTAAVTDNVEAPASDTYKEELANIDTGSTGGVELGYQAEKVDSMVPAETVAAEPVVEEPAPMVTEADSDAAGDIRSAPANYYTVQVIASVNENSIYAFAKKHQLSTRYVVPTVRDGTTWHVLLLDIYPDKTAAKMALDEAASTLPTKPWMRTVGSVQKLMP